MDSLVKDKYKSNKGVDISAMQPNDNYWDCMCDENYIHYHGNGNLCVKCGCESHNMPSSFTFDVDNNYNLLKDKVIFKRHDDV